MITGHCSECDCQFDASNMKAHIGTKFLIFDYGYIICPRCWHKMPIPRDLEEYFGLIRK